MAATQQNVWLDDEFGVWIRELQEKYHIPGTSVAVVDNGRVESAGYGLAQLPDVPATPHTLYQMASTSKAITAATMGLILKDDSKNLLPNTKSSESKSRKMSWKTPLVQILGDDFDMGDPFLTESVTIEDALSHRSGIAGHDFHYGEEFGDKGSDHTRALRHLYASRKNFRTKFQYSNIMFGAVGHVFEQIDGGWAATAKKRIFEPLGMDNTYCGFPPPDVLQNGDPVMARGYHWVDEEDEIKVSSLQDDQKDGKTRGHYVVEAYCELGPIIGAAGSIISSVIDYSKWIKALLEASDLSKEVKEKISNSNEHPPVISHDLWKELTAPRTIFLPATSLFPDVNPNLEYVDISPPVYALGWFVGQYMYAGETILHHSGGIPGFGTHVFLLPKHKLGIVVASNTHLVSNKIAEQIGREIIGRKIGKPTDERRCQGTFAPEKKKPASEDAVPSKEETPSVQVLTMDIPSEPAVKQEGLDVSETDGLPSSFDPKTVLGMYQHAVYGKYNVSVADSLASIHNEKPSLDGVRIVRKSSSPTSSTKSNPKTSNIVLQAEPQGRRRLHHTMLLHPPSAAAKSAQTAEHVFLTIERLWVHGSLMIDPFPGLPLGYGREDDPKYPFKQEPLWEGGAISANVNCGSCFVFDEHGAVRKLGMVLANTPTAEAAMRKGAERELPLENFERKMVWFDKL